MSGASSKGNFLLRDSWRRVKSHTVGFGQVCQNGAPAKLIVQTTAQYARSWLWGSFGVALMSHWCGLGRLCSLLLHSSFSLLPSPRRGFGGDPSDPSYQSAKASGSHWGGFGVALGWLWGRIGVALGWLWGAYQLAINTLWGGSDVALMWLRGGFAVFSSFIIHPSSFAPVWL